MTYQSNFNQALIDIEEQFVELWNDEFKDNKNEWDEDRMNDWMFEVFSFDDDFDNWLDIIWSIVGNFNIHDTFKMIDYIGKTSDESGIEIDWSSIILNCSRLNPINKTINQFIYWVCYETRYKTDYMQYNYYVDASNKIKKWWKKIYWSPKTKVGIKRFNRECEKLGY